MTTRLVEGDMFAGDAECLVNAVNTVGVMGAGLAKIFAGKWPEMLASYKAACKTRTCMIGRVHFWPTRAAQPAWIANLPTKQDWRDPSRYEYVQQGLADLANQLAGYQIRSVAIPALGCGLGGLDFEIVRPMIEKAFEGSDIDVTIYSVPARWPVSNWRR